MHWYNWSVAELQFYLGLFRRFNKPIWLTEFACAYGRDTCAAGQEGYLRAAVPLLEADAHVFRYAWFSGGELAGARLLESAHRYADSVAKGVVFGHTCTHLR